MAILGKNMPSAVMGTAGQDDTDGHKKYNFVCNTSINFIANDSDTHSLLFCLDSPVGSAGTMELKAGETVSDIPVTCREIYAQGVGGTVPFRAFGA